jgi:hypothetical protein
VKRIRREWDVHVTRMRADRLVKILRDYIPTGISPGRGKENGAI